MADSQWRTLYQAAVFEVDPEKIEVVRKQPNSQSMRTSFPITNIFPQPSARICNGRFPLWTC